MNGPAEGGEHFKALSPVLRSTSVGTPSVTTGISFQDSNESERVTSSVGGVQAPSKLPVTLKQQHSAVNQPSQALLDKENLAQKSGGPGAMSTH